MGLLEHFVEVPICDVTSVCLIETALQFTTTLFRIKAPELVPRDEHVHALGPFVLHFDGATVPIEDCLAEVFGEFWSHEKKLTQRNPVDDPNLHHLAGKPKFMLNVFSQVMLQQRTTATLGADTHLMGESR